MPVIVSWQLNMISTVAIMECHARLMLNPYSTDLVKHFTASSNLDCPQFLVFNEWHFEVLVHRFIEVRTDFILFSFFVPHVVYHPRSGPFEEVDVSHVAAHVRYTTPTLCESSSVVLVIRHPVMDS